MAHDPPVRLRGHHLICLHFFFGESYDDRFVRNLAEVVTRLASEDARIVGGADDVCGACSSLERGRCVSEDDVARLDSLALELLGVAPGDVVSFGHLREDLPAVLDEWRAQACADCEWRGVCGPRMGVRAE